MNDLLGKLCHFLDRYPANRYLVGYSGGLDSHVLLHLCARFRGKRGGEFMAVHVNHGLHSDAGRWQEHCQSICEDLGIPFESIAVDARSRSGESPEEAARNARYQAFSGLLKAGEALLLAHHQDDQAETVLLQLMRGTGLGGLSGIGRETRLGAGKVLRPLLDVPRRDLFDYAQKNRLTWIDDPSNLETDFDRNYLRHHIFPLLKQRWPACSRMLARAASHCADADRLMAQWGGPMLQDMLDEQGGLDLSVFCEHSRQAQRWLLRMWLKGQGWRAPSAVFVDRILNEVIPARRDGNPQVACDEVEIRRYRHKLYALPRLPVPDPGWCISWNGDDPLNLPDGSLLEANRTMGRGIDPAKWHRARITVRYRQGGERCWLPDRRGHRSLKKLFQERGVPPWLRERIPLILLDEELVAVGDLWLCDAVSASSTAEAVQLSWTSRTTSFNHVMD